MSAMEAEMRRAVLLLASLAFAACGNGGGSAGPWLTDPGVDGHTRFFPLAGTPHDPTAAGTTVSCDACHPGTTFAEFDCITCHAAAQTDPLHAGVAGYTHTSAGCYSCHRDGSRAAPPDHDTRFFPRGTGTKHAGIACAACHTDLANPTVASNFACASCHLGLDAALVSKHTGSTSNPRIAVSSSEISATDSATCLRCHADSQVDLTSSHPSGSEGMPPHQGARCLQCHSMFRTDKPFGADFATDPATPSLLAARQGCYSCHDTAPPRGD
jgi:hypothetical protein